MTAPENARLAGEPGDSAAIERRAVRGASLLFGRSLVVLMLTAGATIALARILSPSDYGAFAVAVAVQLLGKSAVELGMPTAYVRREEGPTLHEQRALTGFTLVAGASLSAGIALLAFVILPALGAGSETVQVVAVACAALPLWGLRAVPVILIERQMRFGRLVAVEVSETFAFYLFAVPAALAGLGPFSLAAGVPIAAVAGVGAAFIVQRWNFGLAFDLSAIRPVVAFGARLSVLAPAYWGRELGIVVMLTAVGGQALAGFYSIAQRLFSIPIAIASAVYRVSMAALSREKREARAGRGTRAIGITSVAVGLPLALAAGASDPLVAVLFGDRWLPSAEVVVAGSAGMLLTVTATALNGLILAEGDATTPMLASLAGGTVAVAVAAPLGAELGAVGAGLSSTVGFSVAAMVLALRGPLSARAYLSPTARALLAIVGAVAAGHLLAAGTEPSDLAIGLVVSGAAYLLLVLVLSRRDLFTLVRLLRRHTLGGRFAREPIEEEAIMEPIAKGDAAGV